MQSILYTTMYINSRYRDIQSLAAISLIDIMPIIIAFRLV